MVVGHAVLDDLAQHGVHAHRTATQLLQHIAECHLVDRQSCHLRCLHKTCNIKTIMQMHNRSVQSYWWEMKAGAPEGTHRLKKIKK